MAEIRIPYDPATAKQYRNEDGTMDLAAFAKSQGIDLPGADAGTDSCNAAAASATVQAARASNPA
jgi:hypothetical protein